MLLTLYFLFPFHFHWSGQAREESAWALSVLRDVASGCGQTCAPLVHSCSHTSATHNDTQSNSSSPDCARRSCRNFRCTVRSLFLPPCRLSTIHRGSNGTFSCAYWTRTDDDDGGVALAPACGHPNSGHDSCCPCSLEPSFKGVREREQTVERSKWEKSCFAKRNRFKSLLFHMITYSHASEERSGKGKRRRKVKTSDFATSRTCTKSSKLCPPQLNCSS